MTEDPIVAEIRRIREALLDEAGGDMDKVLEKMRAVAAAWPGPTVTIEELHADRAKRAEVANPT